jgi:YegS/Rv2252/BmrU family lipid kinase
MKKAILVYNKNAGRGAVERHVAQIVSVFDDAGYEMLPKALCFGENPMEGSEDVDLVVIAGGDGTINYVVNGIMHKALSPRIGVIPAGTANDFAGAIGMSRDFVQAAKQIIAGETELIDCGRVEYINRAEGDRDRYFVNIFSFGIFTTTSQHTPEQLKHRIGKSAYILAAFKELRNLHGIPLTVTTDGEAFYYPTLMGLVFNGETAGRVPLARMASLKDGVFDCLFLRKRKTAFQSACDMLLYIIGIKTPAVKYLRTSQLTLMSPTSEATDVDGQSGGSFPMRVSCLRGALNIICPHEE